MLKSVAERSVVNIDDEMMEEEHPKILVFGSGESGKTTLLKQIHGMTFSKHYNPTRLVGAITQDILNNLRFVCEKCISEGKISQEEFNDCDYIIQMAKSSSSNTPKKSNNIAHSPLRHSPLTSEKRSSLGGGGGGSPGSPSRLNHMICSKMDDDLAEKILKLYNHSEIFKSTFETCKENERLSDGIEYFLSDSSNLRRVCEFNYVPTIEDIVHSRQKSVGLIETSVRYNEFEGFPKKDIHLSADLEKSFPRTLKIIDTGGQYSERRKWKNNIFSNVRVCIYVVSLAGLTKNLYENENLNDLIDSMDLFKEVFNQPFYDNVPIVLLFNKMDIFSSHIQKGKDLGLLFSEYETRGTILEEKIENSLNFLFNKFKESLTTNHDRLQYLPTTVTKLKDAQQVFELVMQMSGLLKIGERHSVEMNSIDKNKKCTIM